MLNNNFSKNLEKEYKFSNFNYFDIDLDSVFQSSLLCGFTFMNRHREWDISLYKKIENSFEEIDEQELDDLKFIHLYCSERLNKSVNPKDNKLSIIERMYFECSLNKNKNINEWYDYLSEKQNYNYINRNNDEIDNAILSQKMIKDLFGIVNNLNEKLFSKEDVEDIKLYLFENKIFFYKFFNKI